MVASETNPGTESFSLSPCFFLITFIISYPILVSHLSVQQSPGLWGGTECAGPVVLAKFSGVYFGYKLWHQCQEQKHPQTPPWAGRDLSPGISPGILALVWGDHRENPQNATLKKKNLSANYHTGLSLPNVICCQNIVPTVDQLCWFINKCWDLHSKFLIHRIWFMDLPSWNCVTVVWVLWL